MEELSRELVRSWLPQRPAEGHKGTFGKVLIVAGSVGYTGAPVLAAKAAVRGGTGLVFLGVPQSVWSVAAMKNDEAMPFPLPEDESGKLSLKALEPILERAQGCDALLIGPGLGRSHQLDELVLSLIQQCRDKPIVLDADGLNAVSSHIDRIVQANHPALILTPHDGEYARLMGSFPGEDRLKAAKAMAERLHAVSVLKGHRTIIASPEGEAYRNTTGNHGMAKGGSGDVLAGLMVSLLAQGMPPGKAAAAAVWLHGRDGDLAAEQYSYRGMTPTDLIDCLCRVWKDDFAS